MKRKFELIFKTYHADFERHFYLIEESYKSENESLG
jgi:hypothetical protein